MSLSLIDASSEARILVPLDGSTRAESALPVAEQLAQELHRTLLLARIVSLIPSSFAASGAALAPEVYQQLVDDERRTADDYLQLQAQALRRQGFAVETLVDQDVRDHADVLLALCSAQPIGLIVMTSHGRAGLVRFALGSVADHLIRASHIPVLLLRSGDAPEAQTVASLNHILAPLDGSPLAESALPVVRALAGSVAQEVTLLRIISYVADVSERMEASRYLEERAQTLRKELGDRMCSVSTALREGVAADEKITQFAEEEGCLIVMATHGRGGMRRLALGSIADRVAHTAQTPVMIVHPAE